MRVLMAEEWGVTGAELVTPDDPHDALLLIGDPALQARRGLPGFEYKFDLGLEWFNHTDGLPFVFAYWVARRSADPGEVADFERQLNNAFETGISDLNAVVAGRSELDMTNDEKLAYLRGFSYRIGDPERASMDRFRATSLTSRCVTTFCIRRLVVSPPKLSLKRSRLSWVSVPGPFPVKGTAAEVTPCFSSTIF